MGITVSIGQVGEVGVLPRFVYGNSTDDLSTLTSFNYLRTTYGLGFFYLPTDFFFINYLGGNGFFFADILPNQDITLIPFEPSLNSDSIAINLNLNADFHMTNPTKIFNIIGFATAGHKIIMPDPAAFNRPFLGQPFWIYTQNAGGVPTSDLYQFDGTTPVLTGIPNNSLVQVELINTSPGTYQANIISYPSTALFPLTTKGDLLTHNGTAQVRLGVGPNGTVFNADSTQTTGNGWTATLKDSALVNSVAYQSRILFANDGTTASINYSNPSRTFFRSSSGVELIVGPGGSPIANQITINGAISANSPILTSTGSDPNIDMTFETKGTGKYTFTSGTTTLLGVLNVASAVNGWNMSASATGNAPFLSVVGTDADINMQLRAKGNGYVYTNNPLHATNGFIANSLTYPTVDAAAGNVVTTDGVGNLTLQPIPSDSEISSVVEVTGTTQTIVPGTKYIANNAAQVVFTLPTTSAIGKVFAIVGKGAGGWRVAQNASQIQYVGSATSTTGGAGYVESTNRRDGARFCCVVANLEFQTEVAPQGNLTVI